MRGTYWNSYYALELLAQIIYTQELLNKGLHDLVVQRAEMLQPLDSFWALEKYKKKKQGVKINNDVHEPRNI